MLLMRIGFSEIIRIIKVFRIFWIIKTGVGVWTGKWVMGGWGG